MLSEQVEGETVEITQQEDVVFSFEELVVSYIFTIKSVFKDTVLQTFGGEFYAYKIPEKYDNAKLIPKLDDVFHKMDDGESGF